MGSRKNLKGKTVGSLNLTNDESRADGKIYINESLTSINKNVFRLVRLRCEEKGWEFHWTRNGVIYARKNKSTATTRIGNLKDLEEK